VAYGLGSAYGHPTSGDEASVSAMTQGDLVGQHARTLLGGRPTFAVVGDVDAEEMAHQLENAFGAWTGVSEPDVPVSDRMAGHNGPTTIYLIDKPGAAQSVISAGHLSVPRMHPDYLPLVVMNMAFGGQFTSRLNMNLRDAKGYTYGYRSRFEWHLPHSYFSAGGSVQTAVTKESVIETLKEFHDLVGGRPLDEDEFERARLGLIRGYPPTFETPGQVLGRLIDLVHYGLPDDHFTSQVDRLKSVTLDDVHRVAVEHVRPDSLAILVVGDRSVIESSLEELNLPIVHLDYEGQVID
jgi:zinc protease